MEELCASIYTLPEPQRATTAKALWSEMAGDLVAQFPQQYALIEQTGMRICVLSDAVQSPDKKLVRYRTIEASIRRKRNHPTLLDLAVGNLFANATERPLKALHVVNDTRYALWARHAAQVSLSEHVRLIKLFMADFMDTGWDLQSTRLSQTQIAPPLVEHGKGVQPLPLGKFRTIARYPSSIGKTRTAMCVVSDDLRIVRYAAEQLTRSFSDLLGPAAQRLGPVRRLPYLDQEAVNLVLLPDAQDLNDLPELRNTLREAEASGIRFKLAKQSSVSKTYPAMNIAYDMFLLGGGKPWIPHEQQPSFCSMDAGHHTDLKKSRWVKVATDANQTITQVKVTDTPLAEHIPAQVLHDLWPMGTDSIICRDGKLSQEKAQLEQRAAAEHRSLIESKKSPKAILWRQTGTTLGPALFGDAAIDPHGDLLLQTVPQSVQDYIHPVRLTTHGADPITLATNFLHQQAVPGLSLFHMSRLPGALYYADLVSKLTGDGWPKAIGRGFFIPEIIP